jgi:flagellar assembly factor FliW
MKLKTERFGEIEVNEKAVLILPKGILGFNEYTKYVILPADANQDTPFFFLQSLEEGKLSFLILDTFSFFSSYDFELDKQTIEDIGLEKPEDVDVFTVVTAQGSLKDATTNLKAPIVINSNNQIAKQVVLENGDFLIKQPLFNSNKKSKLTVVKG